MYRKNSEFSQGNMVYSWVGFVKAETMSTLWSKLKLKGQSEIVVFNAPKDFEPELKDLRDVRVLRQFGREKDRFHFVLVFATKMKDLDAEWKGVIPTLKTEGIFWVAYPKKSSGIQTDMAGMSGGWDVYAGSPWQPVSMVSVNDTWTAVRFKYSTSLEKERQERPVEEIRDQDGAVVVDRVNRVVQPPNDLARVLAKHPEAKAFFDQLSFTNKKEYVTWIVEAKKKETRDSRLHLALEKMVSQKKNPAEK